MTEKASCAPLREYKEQILTPVQQEDTPREAVKLREGWHSVNMILQVRGKVQLTNMTTPQAIAPPLFMSRYQFRYTNASDWRYTPEGAREGSCHT